jgi:glutathione S-transferase
MITIYHLGVSRSERIIWLAEELGLPYELEIFRRERSGAAPDALRAVHPLGKAPVIRDGDIVLAESGAIVEYLVERYGNGRLSVARDAPNYARYLYWLHFAEGSLMTLLIAALLLARVPETGATGARTRERQSQMLAFIDAEIASRPYFAGNEFTAADVMMTFPFTTLRSFLKYDLAPYAAIGAYLTRIEARPAYQKAMSLAGPDFQ